MRQCIICGFPFEPSTSDAKVNICISCADDLRQENDVEEMDIAIQQEEEEQRWLGTGG